MEVQVNYWGVLLAALTSFAVGGLWYSQSGFGKVWAKLAGIKIDDSKRTATNMTPLLLTQFVLSFVTAYVLAHFIYISHTFFQNSWLLDALSVAFWGWLGFVFCRFWTHDMFEGRRKKLTLLNAGHELVTLLVMAAVLAWLHP